MDFVLDWIDEFYSFIRYENSDISTYMLEKPITNRIAILIAGIFFAENNKVQVNVWLKHYGLDVLTYRNQLDAFFLYVYEIMKDVSIDERLLRFSNYAREYTTWIKDNKKNQKRDEFGRTSSRNIHYDIDTFGQLFDVLARHSVITQTATMHTGTRTEQDVMHALSFFVAQKKSLSDFLSFLDNDIAVQDYNNKSTYHIQKMLYQMFKSSIDIIYCNHLPNNEQAYKDYLETRNFVLSESSGDAFNRFINYNRLFLDGIRKNNNMKNWINEHSESSIAECIKWLKPMPISYERLFTDIYNFYMIEKYHSTKKEMLINGIERGYNLQRLSDKQYINLFGKGIDCRESMRRFFKDIISGNVYVTREFLILFGLYTGYNKEQINKALEGSNFSRLNAIRKFDRLIIKQLDNQLIKHMRDIINKKNFIDKLKDYIAVADENNIEYGLGEKEREEYDEITSRFHNEFNSMISTYDSDFLKTFFKSKKVLHLLNSEKKEFFLIAQALETKTTRILR